MKTPIRLSLAGGVALLLLSVTAGAQAVDTRWQAWIGCWAPALAEGAPAQAPGTSARVCIALAPGTSAVTVATINAGQVTGRSVIEASGEPRQVTRDGCEGTETARWSPIGRRLYLSSSLTCADGTRRSSTGVLSFAEHRQWLDVRSLVVNSASSGVAVGRYVAVDAADTASIPVEVRSALPTRTASAEFAALATSPPLTLADIAEVGTVVEADVASAWLVERSRGLTLRVDAKQLTALADNDVPASVIDVAVALAYPDVFGIARDSREAQRLLGARAAATETTSGGGYRGMPIYGSYYDPYFWSLGPWSYCDSFSRRYSYGYSYGCYNYGSAYGYGSPYGWYGPYYGGTYYSGGPSVVVIRDGGGTAASHGRVVKGRGYTSGGGASGPEARGGGSFTTTSDRSSSSAGSSSSSSGSSGTSSSSGSGGGERTAVRKP